MILKNIIRRFSLRSLSIKHISVDVLLMTLSLYLSLWMRTGSAKVEIHLDALVHLAPLFLAIRLGCFVLFGVYQCMWRYVSIPDATRLAEATGFSTLLMIACTYFIQEFGILPRSFFFIDAIVCMGLLMGARLARRRLYESRDERRTGGSSALSRVLIYGAGSTGRMFAQSMESQPGVEVVGYLDDDPHKLDKVIFKHRVLGNGDDLEKLMEAVSPTDLVVAIHQPNADVMRKIVLLGRKHKVRPQILAEIEAKGFQPKSKTMYREVELKDLLARPSSMIEVDSLREMIQGKCVLVTGAGGSIGAELSRQVERFQPSKLMLLDHSEFNLYEIDKELRPTSETDRVVPLLIDIKDRTLLRRIFEKHRPEVVFHAAAYKHVHLVEANPASAILNNVLGTKNLLDLSVEFNIARFLLVSSDKAVNPAGAMGATKRVCELMTSDAGFRTHRPFSSVRFGNVLGSSGSLIPLLKTQIEEGGPITLTHPEMTRYFMLIPEAVSLVLMSASMAQPGDIGVLRMGEPLRIVDLAKSLLALMGRTEDDIPLVFTGVRPGEKMYEELCLTGDEIQTRHPEILTVPNGDSASLLGSGQWLRAVDNLLRLAEQNSADCVKELHSLIDQTKHTSQRPHALRASLD